MNGARLLARDFIGPLMIPGRRVLDVCCGDAWVSKAFPNVSYSGMDLKSDFDLTSRRDENALLDFKDFPDVILSIYGLQHLLAEEARVWTLLRRIAKPTTKFVYVGRFSPFPYREMGRADPLNAYNYAALEGLAMASGWRIADYKVFEYEGDRYRPAPPDHALLMDCHPNAFASILEPIQ